MSDGAADGSDGDRVELLGLRVVARHGLLPEERERAQPFEVDLWLELDLARAAASDELSDTVDYGWVLATAASVLAGEPVQLLERLAGAVADAVLESDRRVRAVTVAIRKLRPPVPYELRSAGVRIRREGASGTHGAGDV